MPKSKKRSRFNSNTCGAHSWGRDSLNPFWFAQKEGLEHPVNNHAGHYPVEISRHVREHRLENIPPAGKYS
jgi:hypothetical protein